LPGYATVGIALRVSGALKPHHHDKVETPSVGASTSSYATAGIALRVSGALKPHHHHKVETPSVGN
jgi:hypothetical protein